MSHVVLTLIGPDRPGLVEALSEAITEHGGNWLESRMARLSGMFAGILRLEVPDERTRSLVKALEGLGSDGLRLVIEEVAAEAPERPAEILQLNLVGRDRPGIVKQIAGYLASRNVNVGHLATDREGAPMSGETLFRASAEIEVPESTSLEEIRQGLERIASDLMVEIKVLDPRDGA